MSIFNYQTLIQFKQARFGSNILTFDDLVKERNFTESGKEHHVWLARKEKKEYLLLDEDAKDLPLRMNKTRIIKDDKAIYHFVNDTHKVGFSPKRYYDFRGLIDKFCEIKHTNKPHQRLKWIIAMTSLLTRINVRICGNTELGKDSTFIILNHLTNKVSVFDKPKTLAKLEYGLLNDVLMVNELIPTKEEERHDINDFLLSIGSLNPTYPKKTRSSTGTKETYDMAKFSLILCYNTLQEIAEKDKVNYFDYAFGLPVLKRFIPFKLSGKINVKQFREPLVYNEDVDGQLLEIARTIEWYRQNWQTEKKQWQLQTPILGERWELMFSRIMEVIALDAETEDEARNMGNLLLDCHNNYKRMLNNNQLIKDYQQEPISITKPIDFEPLNPEIIDFSVITQSGNSTELKPISPIDFIRQNGKNGEMEIEVFVKQYDESTLERLKRSSDIFSPRPHLIKILE